MNKFGTVLLKIIMVASFIGAIVFVGIAVINNQNISYEAYNYIYVTSQKTDFDLLKTKVESNFKTEFDGVLDPYASFVSTAIEELNGAISYYLDYLSGVKDTTKGEQDKLISLYNTYVESFKSANNYYNKYVSSYNNAQDLVDGGLDGADYAKVDVKLKSLSFVEGYYKCYNKGSDFFKNLFSVVQEKVFGGKTNLDYKRSCYLIEIGLADYSYNTVYENMEKKRKDLSYEQNPLNIENINCFYDFLNKKGDFDDSLTLINKSFKNFLDNLKKVDVFAWAGDYLNYSSTLPQDKKQAASLAKQFFDDNFRGE